MSGSRVRRGHFADTSCDAFHCENEPQWRGLLCVEEIELSADQTSMN
jgi:hypothetical protein